MSEPTRLLVGVDLGKTRCRLAISDGVHRLAEVQSAGSRGLADPGGVDAARAVVLAGLDQAKRQAELDVDRHVDVLLVGAAGSEASGPLGPSLLRGLAAEVRANTVALTSDAVIAHAGAFGGGSGAMVAMGTGAVAVGIGPGGFRQVDGLGYWLGDDGSGAWIGRAGLRAVLRSREGRGPRTALHDAAEAVFGDLAELPATLQVGDQIAATTARFVPEVVRCADQGDAVAAEILAAAGAALADSTMAAATGAEVDRATAIGGLACVDALVRSWRSHLPAWVTVVEAEGTALDGALLLAERADLPHETLIERTTTAPSPIAGSALDRVDLLATEQVRRDLDDLDRRTPDELVDTLLAAEASVPAAVGAARGEIATAVGLIEKALGNGGRLIYVGAGTPGRLAALDAAECPPTFGIDPGLIIAVLAGGGEAAATAVEGAEDRADLGREDLLAVPVTAADVVVGIAASGRTPYVIAALETARQAGARTVGIVNNPDSEVARTADVAIELLTGPEVLGGSTRMKAGTAQKVVLNVISTSAMVRLGKSYGAWMVDVQPSNEKLRRRAARVLREATGVDEDEAERLLVESDWHTKTALVAILAHVDVDRARDLLEASGGYVRAAVDSARGRETT
jgi:N-acetylmuramic acid 6-phosphate etherase